MFGVGVVVVVVVFVVSDLPIQVHRRSGHAGHYRVAPLTWHWVVVLVVVAVLFLLLVLVLESRLVSESWLLWLVSELLCLVSESWLLS